MNPVTSELAKRRTGATELTEAITIDISQQQEEASELAARMAVSMDNVNIDSEAEDAVDSDGSRPGQQVFSTQINQEKPNLPLVQWVLMMWHSTWIWRLDL